MSFLEVIRFKFVPTAKEITSSFHTDNLKAAKRSELNKSFLLVHVSTCPFTVTQSFRIVNVLTNIFRSFANERSKLEHSEL